MQREVRGCGHIWSRSTWPGCVFVSGPACVMDASCGHLHHPWCELARAPEMQGTHQGSQPAQMQHHTPPGQLPRLVSPAARCAQNGHLPPSTTGAEPALFRLAPPLVPAVAADLATDRPHPFMVLERTWWWRQDGSGGWCAFEDKCPHRGVPLSRAIRRHAAIRYLGFWRFTGTPRFAHTSPVACVG
jgi:hypothetical protein